jgi:hypothetical protein
VLSQGACLPACVLSIRLLLHQPFPLYTVVHTRLDRHNGHTASRMSTGRTWVDARAGHMLNFLQCNACKHRKIRCDKEDPCSNCRTTGAGTDVLSFLDLRIGI